MKLSYLIPSIVLLFLFVAGYLNLENKIDKRIATVIDMEALYTSFEFTKQSNKKYKGLVRERSVAIDSMNNIITLLKNTGSKDERTSFQIEKINYGKQLLQQENEKTKLELEQQIWNQLNQYLFDFGQENTAYSIILGSMGDGNIIFAEEAIDITEEAIKFVNKKYLGIN